MENDQDENYQLAFEAEPEIVRDEFLSGFLQSAAISALAGLAVAVAAASGPVTGLAYITLAALVGGSTGGLAKAIYARGQIAGAEESLERANDVLFEQGMEIAETLPAVEKSEEKQLEQSPKLDAPVHADHVTKLLAERMAVQDAQDVAHTR